MEYWIIKDISNDRIEIYCLLDHLNQLEIELDYCIYLLNHHINRNWIYLLNHGSSWKLNFYIIWISDLFFNTLNHHLHANIQAPISWHQIHKYYNAQNIHKHYIEYWLSNYCLICLHKRKPRRNLQLIKHKTWKNKAQMWQIVT